MELFIKRYSAYRLVICQSTTNNVFKGSISNLKVWKALLYSNVKSIQITLLVEAEHLGGSLNTLELDREFDKKYNKEKKWKIKALKNDDGNGSSCNKCY